MSASTGADVAEGVLVTTARPQPVTTRLPKIKGKARKRQVLSVMIIRPEISSPGGGSATFSRSRRNRTFCHGLVRLTASRFAKHPGAKRRGSRPASHGQLSRQNKHPAGRNRSKIPAAQRRGLHRVVRRHQDWCLSRRLHGFLEVPGRHGWLPLAGAKDSLDAPLFLLRSLHVE